MKVLISGLNNYVGRRCASLMADDDFQVFAITRNRKLFKQRLSDPLRAQIFEVDLLRESSGTDIDISALDASFYFTQVPTLHDLVNLRVELLCLRNFIHLIKRLNCNRLVYVARLMDKQSLQPVLDLLTEMQVDYTVVLKNVVVGKDCLLYTIFQRLSGKNVMFHTKQYSENSFQPIGITDFVRWLKASLTIPAFHRQILEVGGAEVISTIDMYKLYRKLKLKLQEQRMVSLPNWLFGFMHKGKIDENRDAAEFLEMIQVNGVVENSWKASLPFTFSPINDILFAE